MRDTLILLTPILGDFYYMFKRYAKSTTGSSVRPHLLIYVLFLPLALILYTKEFTLLLPVAVLIFACALILPFTIFRQIQLHTRRPYKTQQISNKRVLLNTLFVVYHACWLYFIIFYIPVFGR